MGNWKDGLPARERVRQIIETVTDPVSVNWVSKQAGVGWDTAKDELEQLAERGGVRRVDRGKNVRYVPDFTQAYVERIRDLAVTHSRDTLQEELIQAKEEIEGIQERYGVDSRDELEQTLADEEITADEARERQQALRAWEEIADQKQLIRHALHLFDDIRDVDPFIDATGDGGEDEPDKQSREQPVA